MSSRERRVWAVVLALWAGVVGLGVFALAQYKSRPGEPGHAPTSWPAEAKLEHEAGRATLVVLAHPHCPCTRASLDELEAIMAKAGDHLSAHVLFYRPKDAAADWNDSDLWDHAGTIAHTTRSWDEDGRTAARFGAKTSGQTALYGEHGELLFEGGITSARGHVGENLGEDAVIDLAFGRTAHLDTGPVYGCPLSDPEHIDDDRKGN